MTRATDAAKLFREGHGCAEAVLVAYAPTLGLDPDVATRIAAPFASGMRSGEACGAVTGALMVLGLALSAEEHGGPAGVDSAVAEFIERFRESNGSLGCSDVIGCDLRTREGRVAARDQDLFTVRCSKAVRDACVVLDELLAR